jgi:hypothetical protein
MPTYTEKSSPGYVESSNSTKKKTKEDIRYSQLLPAHILEDAPMLDSLLKAYYTFLNLDEFIYQETKTFTDVILSGQAQFRISDPENDNNEFFVDPTGASSTLVVQNLDGTTSNVPLNDINVAITNGNDLPGSLANIATEVGKTFTVTGLSSENNKSCTLTTIVKKYVGPGPSNVMSSIEGALDIDQNSLNYLELMQKEIAASIPRNVTVNKRNLYKQILDFYKVRGNNESVEIFFRLLFNEEVVIERPFDKTLIPSSGNYDTNQNRYLDNKGFLSDRIKLQDSFRFQKFSYLIKTGKNVSDWKDVYDKLVHPAGFIFFGEILILLNLVSTGVTAFRKQLPAIAGVTRDLNSAMPIRQPGAIGIEDLPLLVEAFVSSFLPKVEAKIHKSATFSATLNASGQLSALTVGEPGFGYASAPALTINGTAISGQSIVNPSITIGITSDGQIDVDNITINSAGSGFANIAISAAANPNVGKLAAINTTGLAAKKRYDSAPNLVFEAPTSVDADGNPLGSNVTATATLNLNADGEITGSTITNAGNGYVVDPGVRIGSQVNNEQRAKDHESILIILMNHKDNLSGTLDETNPFEQKAPFDKQRIFNNNNRIEQFGAIQLQNISSTSINRYNVGTFVHEEVI